MINVDPGKIAGSGFCQNRMLCPEDIYRYEHDLEPDGTVLPVN